MIKHWCPKCSSEKIEGVEVPTAHRLGALYWKCEYCGFAFARLFPARPELKKLSRRFALMANREAGYAK